MTEETKNQEQKDKRKWVDSFKSTTVERKDKEENDIKHNANNDIEADQENELEKENIALKDKLLRTLAELENTRRRATEEKEKTIKFAITNFAKDLIVIMENMYLAFKSVEGKEKTGDFSIFFDGIELNFNELKKIFDKNNIKRLYPLNEKFDPNFHEAVVQVESEAESGTIIDVVQAGYLLNDRVLKPACVVVTK